MARSETPSGVPLDPSTDDRIVDAVANERIRVAAELRDGALQALTGMSLQLASAVRRAGSDADQMRSVIAEAEKTLEDELRALRLFVLELVEDAEDSLSHTSLVSELAAMIDRVHRVWGLTTTLTIGAPPPVVDSSRMVRELVRLVQEALTNAARYADAVGAAVHVQGGEGVVHLRVEQVGRGFAFRGAMEHDELTTSRRGPVALKLRVRALGGRLRIESSDDRASVQMEIPTGLKA